MGDLEPSYSNKNQSKPNDANLGIKSKAPSGIDQRINLHNNKVLKKASKSVELSTLKAGDASEGNQSFKQKMFQCPKETSKSFSGTRVSYLNNHSSLDVHQGLETEVTKYNVQPAER